MDELQIKAAKERLAIETELNELIKENRRILQRVDSLQNSLRNLTDDPEWYFRVDTKLKTVFEK